LPGYAEGLSAPQSMEFLMRQTVLLPALGVALLAGTSLARAQTVETVVTPAPMVMAQDRVLVTEPAPVIETIPVQTSETVRTERLTTHPVRRMARRSALRPVDTVTTTRTIVRENIAPAPMAPAAAVIAQPGYTEAVATPPGAYAPPLYDYVPAGAALPAAVLEQPALPAYRYVYQPDRILVIDANTGVAVQALPR
jgi:hypothetical protein